jgi:hypothetical protein
LKTKAVKKGPIPPRKRPIPLRNTFDVSRFLAKLINGVYRDEIEDSKGTKLAYLCGVMLKALELSDFERRLAQLEKNAAEVERQRNEYAQ